MYHTLTIYQIIEINKALGLVAECNGDLNGVCWVQEDKE